MFASELDKVALEDCVGYDLWAAAKVVSKG